MNRRHGLTPVEHSVLVAAWKSEALTSRIHALIGDDSDKLVNGAGRVFFVIIGACAACGLHQDEPDIRILRGAVNALGEQAGEPEVQQQRRAGIVSGLQACDRLMPRLTQRALVGCGGGYAHPAAAGRCVLRGFREAGGQPHTRRSDSMKVNSKTAHETRHFARIEQAELERLIAEAVASAAGVRLDRSGVKVERCFISSRDTSTGPERYAECEIVVDHSPQEGAA